MGTITQRKTKDGKVRYRAQVRVKRQGFPDFTRSKTFSKESLAKDWIKKLEASIELDDSILTQSTTDVTLRELILRYRDEAADQFNPKYSINLARVADYAIAKRHASTLTRQDFTEHALRRFNGNADTEPVSPSTIKTDFSIMSAALDYAIGAWGLPLETAQHELSLAVQALRKRRIVGSSAKLDRLPTNDELIKLTTYFYQSWQRGRTTIPMHLVMWLAIYTARRQDEIANMRLADFDRHNNQWLIRDVKNPDGSAGNHKYAHIEPPALALIDEILSPDVRNRMIYTGYDPALLLPINTRTVSAYFTRACYVCQIDGLRFHDLRHEAATRLAEDGWSVPQLQTVTLHSSWSSLQRYVNLKKRAERIDYWDIISQINPTEPVTTDKPQRHINDYEITQAKIALDQAVLGAASVPYEFLAEQIDSFRQAFRPSKTVVASFAAVGIDDIWLWDMARHRFVLEYVQSAWSDWFDKHGHIAWDDLPDGTTHFNFDNLDAIKSDGKRIYRHDGHWIDITAYADGVIDKCIKNPSNDGQ